MLRLRQAATFDALSQRYGGRYKWIALFILALGAVSGVLCTSSFNVAIPALSRHFGLGQDQAQWTMTGFLAAMTVGMLPTSWLIDRFGFRLVFLLSLTLLNLASVAGYFAPNFALVVAARILQGGAAGVLQPMAALALMRLFPFETQGRASGILTFSIALMPAIAPSMGGLLMDRFGWEAIFLLGVPFAFLASLFAVYLLPTPREVKCQSFDWLGLGWLTLGAVALVESVSSLQSEGVMSSWTMGQFALVIVATALYYWHANNHGSPLISMELFRERTFVIGTFVSFAYGFGLYASTYLIPVFLQNALSFKAGAAGMALLPSGIALVVVLPLAGRMADRYSPKWITLAGLVTFGASFLAFAVQGGRITYGEIIAVTITSRIGLGMILPALTLAVLRHMAAHHLGQSAVVTSYARQLGGVMGVAIIAVFVEWRETIYGALPLGGHLAYSQGFLLISAVFAAAGLATFFMRSERLAP